MPTIKELVKKCKALELEVTGSKVLKNGTVKILKKDYTTALREDYLRRTFFKSDAPIPDHLKLVLSDEISDGVQLADRWTSLKQVEKDEIMESPLWFFEEKYDGVRLQIVKGSDSEKLHFYSRNISVQTWCPCHYNNIKYSFDTSVLKKAGISSFIIDCELVATNNKLINALSKKGIVTDTYLQAVTRLLQLHKEASLKLQEACPLAFRAFDILYAQGSFKPMTLPQSKRVIGLDSIVKVLQKAGLRISSPKRVFGKESKESYLKEILDNGGEGCIAKNSTQAYVSGGRKKTHWVKLKRTVSGSIGDTIDGWISSIVMGTEGTNREGQISGINVSCYIRTNSGELSERVIATISGLTDSLREDLSYIDEDGDLVISPKYLHKVVEIDGQCFSGKNAKLRHAVLKRFRPDKDASDCILEESDIQDLTI
jgi:ATP-dependent DNA ligase